MNKSLAVFVLSTFALTACVSRGRYDQAVSTTETTRAQLQKKQTELDRSTTELTQRTAEIGRLKKQLADLEQLDQTKTGDVVASRAHIGNLQKRLAELEAAQHAAEARAATYKDLTLRLKKQIDAGDLAVVVRDGRMVLQLPNDVLFDSGQTELKPAGKTTLKAVDTAATVSPAPRSTGVWMVRPADPYPTKPTRVMPPA